MRLSRYKGERVRLTAPYAGFESRLRAGDVLFRYEGSQNWINERTSEIFYAHLFDLKGLSYEPAE